MTNSNEIKDTIKIRLVLNAKEDHPIYDYFLEVKNKLGLKANTEVLRYCITKTYETEFES